MDFHTVKAIQRSILSHIRCAVVSDEIVNNYSATLSDSQAVINDLNRSKMNTFLNCERGDDNTSFSHWTNTPSNTWWPASWRLASG